MSTVITLYSRPGCHLCDEVREAVLEVVAEIGGIELDEVDIERDDRLLNAYLERIPVVAVDGKTVSELTFDPHELRAALHTVEQ